MPSAPPPPPATGGVCLKSFTDLTSLNLYFGVVIVYCANVSKDPCSSLYAVIGFSFQHAQRPHGGVCAQGSALDETEPNSLLNAALITGHLQWQEPPNVCKDTWSKIAHWPRWAWNERGVFKHNCPSDGKVFAWSVQNGPSNYKSR